MTENQKDSQSVEQLATVQEHVAEQTSDEGRRSNSKEENFREMRRTLDEIKAEKESKAQEVENLKAELDRLKSGFKKAFDPEPESAENDDDVMTESKYRTLREKEKLEEEIENTPSRYSDYFEVVKFVEPLVKNNPTLLETIKNARNPRETAYQLVKNSYAYRSTIQSEDATKVEANLKKPVPSEALGSGSAPDLSNRRLSLSEKADVWKQAQKFARGG